MTIHMEEKTPSPKSHHCETLDYLFKQACSSQKIFRVRMVAGIFKGRKLISTATNYTKTDPLQARFKCNPHSIYLHAEVAAIKQAMHEIGAVGISQCTMYIVRARQDDFGNFFWGLAKPCNGCRRAIEEFNLRRIVYTTNETGKYIEEMRFGGGLR